MLETVLASGPILSFAHLIRELLVQTQGAVPLRVIDPAQDRSHPRPLHDGVFAEVVPSAALHDAGPIPLADDGATLAVPPHQGQN